MAVMIVDVGHAMAQDLPPGGQAVPFCSIEEQASGALVTLRGLASAAAPVAGRYRLQIRKSGPAGTSNVAQAGDFALEPGTSARVGEVGISIEPGGRYEAVLTLETKGGDLECRASGPRVTPI